jgi:hypothetical protein
MRSYALALLAVPLLLACGEPAPVAVTGAISADGSCSATIGEDRLSGPAGGVRVVSPARSTAATEPQRVIVVYCLLTGPEEEPVRIDFVKLGAPDTGFLEPGSYVIDMAGDQPRSIGVIVTAPGYLDITRDWQPTVGTLQVTDATATTVQASFEMELVPRGARTY